MSKARTAPLTEADLRPFAEGAAIRYTLHSGGETHAGIGKLELENGDALMVSFDWLIHVEELLDTQFDSEWKVLTGIPPVHEPYTMSFERPTIPKGKRVATGLLTVTTMDAVIQLSNRESDKLILEQTRTKALAAAP